MRAFNNPASVHNVFNWSPLKGGQPKTSVLQLDWWVKQADRLSYPNIHLWMWKQICSYLKWKLSLQSVLFGSLNLSKWHDNYKQTGWLLLLPLEWQVRVKWPVGTDGSGLEGALMNFDSVSVPRSVILSWQSCGVCSVCVIGSMWLKRVQMSSPPDSLQY